MRPCLRLIVPALQVGLLSKLVKTRNNADGIISISTFNKYRPFYVKNPTLKDGLCHHCMKRRTLIKVIHKHFKETNPEYECKDREKNKGWHLELWRQNSAKYPSVDTLLNKFDPFCEHLLRTDSELRASVEETISNLTSLERHFRLANAYKKRNRAIHNDFNKTLGPQWVRITNDAKNPLVIGLGGVGGGA